jgi:hypothetical protein
MGMPLYQEGTLTPIFEGDMPPKKRTPKSGSNIGAIAGDNNLFPQWLPLTYLQSQRMINYPSTCTQNKK